MNAYPDGLGSMRLIESGPPKTVVWCVWERDIDEHPRFRRFCSVFATEALAKEYVEALAYLQRDEALIWDITDEWVMGA
jgi:hypothetical protein